MDSITLNNIIIVSQINISGKWSDIYNEVCYQTPVWPLMFEVYSTVEGQERFQDIKGLIKNGQIPQYWPTEKGQMVINQRSCFTFWRPKSLCES